MFNTSFFKRKDIPADYGKMPDTYDFSTKGIKIIIMEKLRNKLERL
jgi:hypothetical protein